jgi:hypothetical protein
MQTRNWKITFFLDEIVVFCALLSDSLHIRIIFQLLHRDSVHAGFIPNVLEYIIYITLQNITQEC